MRATDLGYPAMSVVELLVIDQIIDTTIDFRDTFFFRFDFYYAFWRGETIRQSKELETLYEYCPGKAILYLKELL